MKRTTVLSILSLLTLYTIVFCCNSCKKSDDNDPSSNNLTNGKTTAVFNPSVNYGTMTDQDGNVYKTVIIGTQTWMAENLRTTKYNDGTAIPNITNDTEWGNLTTGAYCNYKNTVSIDTIATYGRLYNWYAVNTGKLAPAGWHVPTNDEWTQLTDYLGGLSVAGDKLKEIGTMHWKSPNAGATNEVGFTALPGGSRLDYGPFSNFGFFGNWWSTTGGASRHVYYNVSYVNCYTSNKLMGLSVRCIKD